MAEIKLEPLPHREAVEYFRSKGFAPALQRFHHLDHFREEHARDWVVAKAVRDDVSAAIRAEFDRAFAEGRTLAQFQADLKPRLQELGWWGKSIQTDPVTGEQVEVQLGSMRRLRTIFDTNMRTAHAAGHWARIQRTRWAFPFLEYVQIERPTKRHDHARFHGLIRPVDDPVWLRIYPPNGWFCGCTVRQLTKGQMEREGKVVSDPLDLDEEPWTNKRTGETFQVPKGVHPGFDTNPGATWLDIEEGWDRVAADLSPDRRASERGHIQGLRLQRLNSGREAVMVADDALAPAGPRTADPATPDRVSLLGLRITPESSILHSHFTDASLSRQDVETLFAAPARSIAAISPGGSLWRAIRVPGALPRLAITGFRTQAAAEFTAFAAMDQDHATIVYQHAMMLWLEREGVITYRFHVSSRVRQILEAHADLLARLLP